jgi:vesicle coat complex subunit
MQRFRHHILLLEPENLYQVLLQDTSTMVIGSAVSAFMEVCAIFQIFLHFQSVFSEEAALLKYRGDKDCHR